MGIKKQKQKKTKKKLEKFSRLQSTTESSGQMDVRNFPNKTMFNFCWMHLQSFLAWLETWRLA